MLPILRFGVCRSSDSSIHVRRIFPRTNALLQPSLGAMTALPMTGFHRVQDLPCTESNTLEIQLLSEFCHPLCTLWFIGCRRRKEIPSVSGILTRFPCSANKHACPIARVAHLPQKPCYSVYYMRACFTHTKRPLLPCDLAGKRSLVFSVYSVWLHAKNTKLYGWLVGWLVGWLQELCQLFIFL